MLFSRFLVEFNRLGCQFNGLKLPLHRILEVKRHVNQLLLSRVVTIEDVALVLTCEHEVI